MNLMFMKPFKNCELNGSFVRGAVSWAGPMMLPFSENVVNLRKSSPYPQLGEMS